MCKKVRELRKSHKYSTQDMANIIGVKTAGAYCKKELGYTPYSLAEAKKIADLFEKTVDELFFASEVSHVETTC